jgi:uncharacterized membrane protein YfhO
MEKLKNYYPHALALIGFVLITLIYFYPVLQGKSLFQSDIVQYMGMSKELRDFRTSENAETYWTNSAFGGMPTYQTGALYPNNYIKKLDLTIRFLPRPADYVFLYLVSFYILLISFKIKPLHAFFGALAFGFSTYLIIILGAGHNAKAHAIAYMPLVLAGIKFVLNKRYILGGLLTTIAAALEIQANHFQMTYYLLFLIVIVVLYYFIRIIKEKDFKHLAITKSIFIGAALLAVGLNATNLLATKQYADFSTRGKNELTVDPDGKPLKNKVGMSYDYITEYSYGKAESLNLIAPRLMGGGTGEKLDAKSEVVKTLIGFGAEENIAIEFASGLPVYWGDQPSVAAPAYIGAVVFFLFILAFFADYRKYKYAFLAAALLSLFLSWGKNFPAITNFFIDYFPLYNKFRAVSSIQVILELCLPLIATVGFYYFMKAEKLKQLQALKWSSIIVISVFVILFLAKGLFNFEGGYDQMVYENLSKGYGMEMADQVIKALKTDRQALYTADILRSLFFVTAAILALFVYHKEKLNYNMTAVIVGLLMFFDLVMVNINYVNKDNFVSAYEMEEPFQKREVDELILRDKGHYRVYDFSEGFNGARNSFFHKSLGGYSAVKPQRMQQIYDYHLEKQNTEVFNMFNVKYIIYPKNDTLKVQGNTEANGHGWFVDNIKKVKNADQEINSLTNLDSKKTAVIQEKFAAKLSQTYNKDSLAQIKLTSYKPNFMVYESTNRQKGLAVFSEIYYPDGWIAKIDNQTVDILNVNYVLRAIEVPAGQHKITFEFKPEVVAKGSMIAGLSSIVVLLLIVGGLFIGFKNYNENN